MINQRVKFKKGFSLVEIITILFIVSLGLVGILSLIVQNIQSQSYNKNNLIAYQLAQEGIELIRKVRDSNWKAGFPATTNLSPHEYFMDYRNNIPIRHEPQASDAELILKQDSDGFYFHDLSSSATSSIFSRLINIQGVNASSFRVTVRVTWSERNRNYAYDLETLLYAWK